MRKYLFFTIVCLVTGLVVIPFGALAAAKIKLSHITPKIVRQNDIKIFSIKGSGFQKGAGLDLGEGITVLSVNIADKKIKAHITVDLVASTGKRDVVVTNPDGGKGQKKRGLLVKKCTENCEDFGPFEGNPIPIHDKNSSQYRTDCTNAACHRNKLKETYQFSLLKNLPACALHADRSIISSVRSNLFVARQDTITDIRSVRSDLFAYQSYTGRS